MDNNLNQGVLFLNDNPTSDKAPKFRGSINVGGKEYYLAAWQNTTKDKTKDYISLKLTEPDVTQAGAKTNSQAASSEQAPARKQMF